MAAIWREIEYNMVSRPAAVFPDSWDQVTFRSPEQLAQQLDRFCHHEPERRTEVATYMRQRCLASFSLQALAQRLMKRIAHCLADAVNGPAMGSS
jgi:hypothetical protein